MFALSRKKIFNLSIGLSLAVCSSCAFSAQGLITQLYDIAGSELILVTAGGLSCSVQTCPTCTTPIPAQRTRITMNLLSEAKARGRQIILNCPAGVGITQITLL